MRRFFQTIFKPFKKAWVWYLILLLALSALVWFVGPLVYFTSVGWRLFVILIFVIAWALNALRLQHKKLTEEHKAQANQDQLPAIVDHSILEKAIADLQGKYRKALQSVAKRNPWTLFITFRKNQLPWYLVLGSQGSGKTTMLIDSGLHFPLGNDALIDMKDKPEVLVQWRFSKDAVFIDTDGMLTTFTDNESLAGKVWHELLELMSWHKIRKSLNGIIVTISLQELLAQTPQQRQQAAHALRSRISEIEAELGVKYPVYVQVTKTDILAGFKEFFDHFTENQRDQIWGMTFPDRVNEDVVHLFPQEFDLLVQRLNDYILLNLQNVNDPGIAALITMFASQFASCKSALQSLLNQVFETNHYQEKGYLRGVFFISCKQDTKPINRLLLAEAGTLGIQQFGVEPDDVHNKVYFIHNLFRNIILQETHLMQMSTDQARKMNLHRKSAYVVVAIAMLLMSYVWINSLVMNKQHLNDLNDSANNYLVNYQAYYSDRSDVSPSLADLYLMKHTFSDADPLAMHWGLYQGGRFSDVITTIYLIQLRRQFVPLLQQTIEQELKNNIRNPSQSYNFLRVYLMLADPSRLDPVFVESWMKGYWQQTLPTQPVIQATLNENLAEYLKLNKNGITPDKNLIESVRVILRGTSPAERVYYDLQNQAGGQEVSISNEFDSDFSEVFGINSLNQKISVLYTKDGYNNIYKKDLTSMVDAIADSNWIIGVEGRQSFTADQLASIQQRVATMYMQNYTQAWLALLSKFTIAKFASLQDASQALDLLSQPTSPMKQILDAIYKNTTLEAGDANPSAMSARKGSSMTPNNPTAAVSQAKSLTTLSGLQSTALKAFSSRGSNLPTTQVGADFYDLNAIVRSSNAQAQPGAAGDASNSPYGAIQTAISNVYAYVQNISNAPDSGRAAYEAATARMSGKGDDPISVLIQLANRSPAPLKQWLTAIAQNTWAVILGQAKAYINQAWQQNVAPAYEQLLQYRYPLYGDSTNDTSMSDFTTFFAPGGIFDSFFTQYLQPFVTVSGGRFTMNVVDGSSLPIATYNAQQLQTAYYIEQALFGSGKQMSVAFTVQPIDLSQDVASALLNVGTKTIEYSHGPLQSTPVVWPGDNNSGMASLTFRSLTGAQQGINTSGDWAWLKLLDKAQIKRSYSASTVQAIFTVNGRTAIYAIDVKGKNNPFDVSIIHSLRLPNTL